jgi:hypothetical protein
MYANTQVFLDWPTSTLGSASRQAYTLKPRPKRLARAALYLQASPEWLEWLRRLAKIKRPDLAKLVDHATALYAQNRGFDEWRRDRI